MEFVVLESLSNSARKKKCDKIFNLLYKCATTENISLKQKCDKIANQSNSTFVEMYMNCVYAIKD